MFGNHTIIPSKELERAAMIHHDLLSINTDSLPERKKKLPLDWKTTAGIPPKSSFCSKSTEKFFCSFRTEAEKSEDKLQRFKTQEKHLDLVHFSNSR